MVRWLFYKRGGGCKLRTTENKSSWWSGRDSVALEASRFQIQRSNHSLLGRSE